MLDSLQNNQDVVFTYSCTPPTLSESFFGRGFAIPFVNSEFFFPISPPSFSPYTIKGQNNCSNFLGSLNLGSHGEL